MHAIDANFVAQATPVLQLYAQAAFLIQAGFWVVCVDEKTSIQARERIHESQPATPRGKTHVNSSEREERLKKEPSRFQRLIGMHERLNMTARLFLYDNILDRPTPSTRGVPQSTYHVVPLVLRRFIVALSTCSCRPALPQTGCGTLVCGIECL